MGLDAVVGGKGWGAGAWNGTTTGAVQTTVNDSGGSLDSSDTTLTVADSSPSGHQIVATDEILIGSEILTVTNVSSNDLSVDRAQKGTDAATHTNLSLIHI